MTFEFKHSILAETEPLGVRLPKLYKMNPPKKRIVLVVMLLLSVANFARIAGNDNIRLIQFLSIFVIGLLSGILLQDILQRVRSTKNNP